MDLYYVWMTDSDQDYGFVSWVVQADSEKEARAKLPVKHSWRVNIWRVEFKDGVCLIVGDLDD